MKIRNENRPGAAGNEVVRFGPWKTDVLIRSFWTVFVNNELTDANKLATISIVVGGAVTMQFLPAGDYGAVQPDAGSENVVQAFPGAGPSTTIRLGGGGVFAGLTQQVLSIPIPYNLILPNNAVFEFTITNGDATDQIGECWLTLEDGREAAAYFAKGRAEGAQAIRNGPRTRRKSKIGKNP